LRIELNGLGSELSGSLRLGVMPAAMPPVSCARQIRAFPHKRSSELTRRIEAADRMTRRLDQQQRMASSLVCPLIENDHCAAYAARPLQAEDLDSWQLQCASPVGYDQPYLEL
jgi:hypothetical protein